MNDQFDHNLSAILRELAEEAVPVNLTEPALRRARRRILLATATTIAATSITVGVIPLAMAATGNNGRPASPSTVNSTVPVPSPTGPAGPIPSPPRPDPTGPVPSPS